MRRRELLAATAGISVLAGCLDDGSEPADQLDDTDESDPPFEIRTVDAPGSEAGTVQIPQAGRVMLLNFTRTRCPTSEGLLSAVGDARDDLRRADVDVISVTDGSAGPQPSPAELADWWREHDGSWTIGIDEDGLLNDYYEIRGFPVVMAIDGAGEVHWRNDGPTAANNMVSGVRTALEAQETERLLL
ncbi:TlpA family protein disulfide reductase [Natronorubrum sp. A-ect3]|uniref:TlpA family protein disulfide reductase n=1 Tax=Natronorubrum sp. A-ect3 TaxID=3242698 RepID=UPI00359E6D71